MPLDRDQGKGLINALREKEFRRIDGCFNWSRRYQAARVSERFTERSPGFYRPQLIPNFQLDRRILSASDYRFTPYCFLIKPIIMKTQITFLLSFCVSILLAVPGCGGPDKGGPVAPVSGTLTLDGEAMPGVQIVFSPLGTMENSSPGPYSVATTDAQGKYQLKTRYGDNGAVIGKHSVTFSYPDIEDGVMAELGAELREAKASEEENREEIIAEVQSRIDALQQKIKGRKLIPSTANREIDVPEGGNTSLNFELVSD
jgi:hypothetical protein